MSEISPTRIGLLAVAEPPKGAPSVGDWVPFPPGKSLNEIIRTCNAECSVSYDQSNMLPDFKERREVLDLRPYDLDTLDDVGTDELKDVTIVLLDAEAIERRAPASEKALAILGGRMLLTGRPFHLPQLGRAAPAKRFSEPFELARVYPRPIADEATLLGFLRRFCEFFRFAAEQARPLVARVKGGPPDPGLQLEYQKQITNLAGLIRDEAIRADLPRAGVIDLAQKIFSGVEEGGSHVERLQKLSRDLGDRGLSGEAVTWAKHGGAGAAAELRLEQLIASSGIEHHLILDRTRLDPLGSGRILNLDGPSPARPGTGGILDSGGFGK